MEVESVESPTEFRTLLHWRRSHGLTVLAPGRKTQLATDSYCSMLSHSKQLWRLLLRTLNYVVRLVCYHNCSGIELKENVLYIYSRLHVAYIASIFAQNIRTIWNRFVRRHIGWWNSFWKFQTKRSSFKCRRDETEDCARFRFYFFFYLFCINQSRVLDNRFAVYSLLRKQLTLVDRGISTANFFRSVTHSELLFLCIDTHYVAKHNRIKYDRRSTSSAVIRFASINRQLCCVTLKHKRN